LEKLLLPSGAGRPYIDCGGTALSFATLDNILCGMRPDLLQTFRPCVSHFKNRLRTGLDNQLKDLRLCITLAIFSQVDHGDAGDPLFGQNFNDTFFNFALVLAFHTDSPQHDCVIAFRRWGVFGLCRYRGCHNNGQGQQQPLCNSHE